MDCSHVLIPERTQEGLAPLACPRQGEGSLGRGWELPRRSAKTRTRTNTQREIHFATGDWKFYFNWWFELEISFL